MSELPPLVLAEWQPTRDTLQMYARVLSVVRRALTPPEKHWAHVSLRVGETGLQTPPIAAGDLEFKMTLDLVAHQIVVKKELGEEWRGDLRGQSVSQFWRDIRSVLEGWGIGEKIQSIQFEDNSPREYDRAAAERYRRAVTEIDARLKQFKRELTGEISPVQLWSHHFDLAMLWFSGRRAPDADPNDEENGDEQMNFGFSTGDEGTPNAYFYATAYPFPKALVETRLPGAGIWHTEGWYGGLLMYEALVGAKDAGEELLNFFRTVQRAGAELMGSQ